MTLVAGGGVKSMLLMGIHPVSLVAFPYDTSPSGPIGRASGRLPLANLLQALLQTQSSTGGPLGNAAQKNHHREDPSLPSQGQAYALLFASFGVAMPALRK